MTAMCANHPDRPVSAFCRECGKPLCTECRIDMAGAVYCAAHVPAPAGAPFAAAADPARHAARMAGNAAAFAADLTQRIVEQAGGRFFPSESTRYAASNYTRTETPVSAPAPAGSPVAETPAPQAAAPRNSESTAGSGATGVGMGTVDEKPWEWTRYAGYPETASAPPYAPAPGPAPSPYTAIHTSPVLALLLGFIPGVGAIYNGQYAKGLIHAIIFGLLISLADHGGPMEAMFGILIGVWVFYMVFEAFHTASKRQQGIPVDELSSIINLHGSQRGFPLGAIILIGLGLVLLLNTTGLISMDHFARFWPVGLILVGVFMLRSRVDARGRNGSKPGDRYV